MNLIVIVACESVDKQVVDEYKKDDYIVLGKEIKSPLEAGRLSTGTMYQVIKEVREKQLEMIARENAQDGWIPFNFHIVALLHPKCGCVDRECKPLHMSNGWRRKELQEALETSAQTLAKAIISLESEKSTTIARLVA